MSRHLLGTFLVTAGIALVGAVAMAAPSNPVTLTMDDLPTQEVDGLVHPSGVEFGFAIGGVADGDARYAAGGPGSLAFIQDPSIEGTAAGVLSVEFPVPVVLLEFGVARNRMNDVPDAATVELFDEAGVSLGTSTLNLSVVSSFAEGQFSHSGFPVKLTTIDFTTSSFDPGGERFVFDNLTFVPVPEPTSLMLAIAMFAVCIEVTRRHKR